MIIKRTNRNENEIVKEKLFAVSKNYKGQSETFIRDIIKILAMGNDCPGDIDHWVDVAYSGWNGIVNDSVIKHCSEILVGFGTKEEIEKCKLTDKKKELMPQSSTPEQYFKYFWKQIYDQKDNNKYKYRHLISPTLPKSEIKNYLNDLL